MNQGFTLRLFSPPTLSLCFFVLTVGFQSVPYVYLYIYDVTAMLIVLTGIKTTHTAGMFRIHECHNVSVTRLFVQERLDDTLVRDSFL